MSGSTGAFCRLTTHADYERSPVWSPDGKWLDGGKSYKLNIPANVPAKDFWSIVVYDPQTRSQLQTGQPFPAKNSKRQFYDRRSAGFSVFS